MLGMRNAENEVDHFRLSPLYCRYCWIWFRMKCGRGSRWRRSGLGEDSRTIGEGIPDRSPKLPEDLSQCLLEIIVDHHVLIEPKVRRR